MNSCQFGKICEPNRDSLRTEESGLTRPSVSEKIHKKTSSPFFDELEISQSDNIEPRIGREIPISPLAQRLCGDLSKEEQREAQLNLEDYIKAVRFIAEPQNDESKLAV